MWLKNLQRHLPILFFSFSSRKKAPPGSYPTLNLNEAGLKNKCVPGPSWEAGGQTPEWPLKDEQTSWGFLITGCWRAGRICSCEHCVVSVSSGTHVPSHVPLVHHCAERSRMHLVKKSQNFVAVTTSLLHWDGERPLIWCRSLSSSPPASDSSQQPDPKCWPRWFLSIYTLFLTVSPEILLPASQFLHSSLLPSLVSPFLYFTKFLPWTQARKTPLWIQSPNLPQAYKIRYQRHCGLYNRWTQLTPKLMWVGKEIAH